MKKNLQQLCMRIFAYIIFLITVTPSYNLYSTDYVIPTDSSQQDFLKTYKMIMYASYADYPSLFINKESLLFPAFGEYSVYWAKSGADKGSFMLPGKVPSLYSSVTSNGVVNYNWKSEKHYSIQYKPHTKRIAIFRSKIKHDNNTVSWGAIYFKNLFDTYLWDNIYYFVDEDDLTSENLDGSTQLLIIPSFTIKGNDNKFYIDRVFEICPDLKLKLGKFLSNGGMIYTEGNAAYFVEKLGYLNNGAIDFSIYDEADRQTNLIGINFNNSDHPIAFTQGATGGELYTNMIPRVTLTNGEIFAATNLNNYPAVFELSGDDANGGRILSNLGLPTIGGIKEAQEGSRQLQWSLNTILTAFIQDIDVTRSVWNELPDTLTAGKNAVSYDRLDEFEIRITIRNLSELALNDIRITEGIRPFFKFSKMVTTGLNYDINGSNLVIKGLNLNPLTEMTIVYTLTTPEPEDPIHENVDKYIQNILGKQCIYASFNTTSYQSGGINYKFWKYRNYAEIMFSAFLVADTDLNWKNFLGLYYQPFKVFMIMENKERTSAEETRYVQYIPKDVPFYWSDKSINIPILKTPGGKYVDVLRGSNDEKNPEYDMDGDGHPDVWLDTASIYPKGYTITEEEVYWLNPWEHLRTGDTTYYEDINHDGVRALDLDGDGIVDVEAPGDKIRVWKLTWNIGKVAGYDYFDPYCSYEIWVDPPPLVQLSAGAGKAHGKLDQDVVGMYYPYTPDINDADISDTSWSHWMERDKQGNVIWKQLIYQKINNYEGFTFIDTAKTGYKLKSTDYCAGTVPQPHREFIAVLSLGGEEIDMQHYRPTKSLYSNLNYKTIFGEERTCPIRSTYTYYAPLPNPLQFEFLSNNYLITNDDGDTLKYLPKSGKVNLTFNVDASTEYSYYWIRNVGHDVDYNDSSEEIEGIEELGDGVFGYMVYDIPKGMGGYNITFPKKPDGSYDINKIVQVDGQPFKKWIDNPNTKSEIEIWEDSYQYHIYIPQLLIPPALDDDNRDGIDDWIDDRGDRFQSKTGFLHDRFMLDDGEDWPDYPVEPFQDDIYGMVTSGWYHGADGEYGDDFFETLGKTRFTFNCIYEGQGREGPVEISKGGWLVVEEIFGGSPWVIFSHVLSGYAQGVNYQLIAKSNPSVVRYGFDTTYVKYSIKDEDEPHEYGINFDPYHVSYGYGETTITTYAGGKDPCSLIVPSFNMSTIIDTDFDYRENVTLIPDADPENPELEDYPKTVSGCFLEVKIEVSNGTDDDWFNTRITPQISSKLGNTEIVMSYVAYPRPLAPAKVDPATGEIIQGGDDIGSFKAGWRFNQPEGEVLVKAGNTLPLMQPWRRAYFVFLFSIDKTLNEGIYDIDFTIDGIRKHYTETSITQVKKDKVQNGNINFEVPSLKFAISEKNSSGNVRQYQKLIIGNGKLENIKTHTSDYFRCTENVKWSKQDVNFTDFDYMTNTLSANYDNSNNIETIDLGEIGMFPTTEMTEIFILEQGEVLSYGIDDDVDITVSSELNFDASPIGKQQKVSASAKVSTIGPKLSNFKSVKAINGMEIDKNAQLLFKTDEAKDIETMIQITNYGNDMAENTILEIDIGKYFVPIIDKLPPNCKIENNKIIASMGACLPGEKKPLFLHFTELEGTCECMFDTGSVIPKVDIQYTGKTGMQNKEPVVFSYSDLKILDFPAPDLYLYDLKGSKSSLEYGGQIIISAYIQNGVAPVDGVEVNIYGFTNKGDTLILSQELIDHLDPNEKTQVKSVFSIDDTLEYIEFYAFVEYGQEGREFCSENNDRRLQIPFKGPNWIIGVSNSPNPIDYMTYISYYLPRELKNLEIIFYNLDGIEMDRINNCETEIGRHSIYWYCANNPKGAYIYTFEGIDEKGQKLSYNGVMIKD